MNSSSNPHRDGRRLSLLAFVLAALAPVGITAAATDSGEQPLRVLHVMSYHHEWDWNHDQFEGFKAGMGDLDVEYEVIEMDTKRRSSAAWKEEVGARARARFGEWQPDLVYTNDDNAQVYFGKFYVGDATPFVFSGVNAEPANYGYQGSSNVTGVREVEHSLQTVRLLRQIVPGVRKIALIADEGPTWPAVVARVQAALADEQDVEVVAVDYIKTFAEYKQRVAEYQGTVDALGILGVFTFTGDDGEPVPYEEVLRWTAENSRLPDFSFWGDRVELGTLVAVRVSGYAQGQAAGEMARAILADGRSPADIPMQPTVRGEPVVSLARARALGLKVPSTLLLNTHVVTRYRWGS